MFLLLSQTIFASENISPIYLSIHLRALLISALRLQRCIIYKSIRKKLREIDGAAWLENRHRSKMTLYSPALIPQVYITISLPAHLYVSRNFNMACLIAAYRRRCVLIMQSLWIRRESVSPPSSALRRIHTRFKHRGERRQFACGFRARVNACRPNLYNRLR